MIILRWVGIVKIEFWALFIILNLTGMNNTNHYRYSITIISRKVVLKDIII